MTDSTSKHAQLLHAWFSPSMPTGAFAYSHGLESAIASDQVHDAHTLNAWVTRLLSRGSGRNDACFTTAAWHAEHRDDLHDKEQIDSLARALVASSERLEEGLAQGRSFARAASAWVTIGPADEQRMLSVTTGVLCARVGLPLRPVLVASLQAFVSNLVWIGARLIPLGQQQALTVIAELLPHVNEVAGAADSQALDVEDSSLSDSLGKLLGSATPLADIASMRHQHLTSRVCLS